MYTAEAMNREEIRRERRAEALKQRKDQRKLFLLTCLTLLMVFAVGFGFGTLFTRAEEPEGTQAYKYYTNIEIQRGDTLWDIADAYMDSAHYANKREYLNELMELNHMVTDKLISGQKLIVPYYSSESK